MSQLDQTQHFSPTHATLPETWDYTKRENCFIIIGVTAVNQRRLVKCNVRQNRRIFILVSVCDHLPRLNTNHKVSTVNEELPDQYVIRLFATLIALESVNMKRLLGLTTFLRRCEELMQMFSPLH